MSIQDHEYIIANVREFLFNFDAVLVNLFDLGLVSFRLFLLLNGGDDSPRGPTGPNDILVGHREEISLFNSEFKAELFFLNKTR